MRQMVRRGSRVRRLAAGLALTLSASAVSAGWLETFHAVRSRVLAMSHGYHTAAEWNAVISSLDELASSARQAGDPDGAVEARLLHAWALSDVLGRPGEALDLIRGLRGGSAPVSPEGMRRLFMAEARILAEQGDEQAVLRLIEAYRQNPWYDGDDFVYSGGQGLQTPLALRRPHAGGADSLTVSIMERRRREARLAPGNPCPDFQALDLAGRDRSLRTYAGGVLLIDFWVARWPAWRRDLPLLVRLHRQYGDRGFHLLGVGLDADSGDGLALHRREGAPWPQAADGRNLAADFGVFGEAGNLLIDRHGIIRGRNLRGADLAAAVRRIMETSE